MDWEAAGKAAGDLFFRVGPYVFGGLLFWWALIKFLEKPPWWKDKK